MSADDIEVLAVIQSDVRVGFARARARVALWDLSPAPADWKPSRRDGRPRC
jgi:hypothetical protein